MENIKSDLNIKCPNCGSSNIYVHTKKQFGWGRGCLLAIIFWPLIFLGFTKNGKVEKVCLNCNKKF